MLHEARATGGTVKDRSSTPPASRNPAGPAAPVVEFDPMTCYARGADDRPDRPHNRSLADAAALDWDRARPTRRPAIRKTDAPAPTRRPRSWQCARTNPAAERRNKPGAGPPAQRAPRNFTPRAHAGRRQRRTAERTRAPAAGRCRAKAPGLAHVSPRKCGGASTHQGSDGTDLHSQRLVLVDLMSVHLETGRKKRGLQKDRPDGWIVAVGRAGRCLGRGSPGITAQAADRGCHRAGHPGASAGVRSHRQEERRHPRLRHAGLRLVGLLRRDQAQGGRLPRPAAGVRLSVLPGNGDAGTGPGHAEPENVRGRHRFPDHGVFRQRCRHGWPGGADQRHSDPAWPPPPAPGSTSGCEPGDFPPPPAPGSLALIERGTCTFAVKALNAAAAGYAGALIFNEGQPGRQELLGGTLGAETRSRSRSSACPSPSAGPCTRRPGPGRSPPASRSRRSPRRAAPGT